MNQGFNDYQVRCRETALYQENIEKQIAALQPANQDAATLLVHLRCIDYAAEGLGGEAGELLNQVKKITRDDDGVLTQERRSKLIEEIGGVLWYCAQMCTELRLTMGDVAAANLALLRRRKQEGTIQGDARKVAEVPANDDGVCEFKLGELVVARQHKKLIYGEVVGAGPKIVTVRGGTLLDIEAVSVAMAIDRCRLRLQKPTQEVFNFEMPQHKFCVMRASEYDSPTS